MGANGIGNIRQGSACLPRPPSTLTWCGRIRSILRGGREGAKSQCRQTELTGGLPAFSSRVGRCSGGSAVQIESSKREAENIRATCRHARPAAVFLTKPKLQPIVAENKAKNQPKYRLLPASTVEAQGKSPGHGPNDMYGTKNAPPSAREDGASSSC